MLLTIEEIKLHLRMDTDPDSEVDTELERMYYAALEYCENYINRKIPWCSDEDVPRSILQAILLKIGEFYENREALNFAAYHQNPNIDQMLHFYRVGLGI